MKITKEQWKKIDEINEIVKPLDPILKQRIIDIELKAIFGDEYSQLLSATDRNELSHVKNPELPKVVTPLPANGASQSVPTIKEFFDEKMPLTAVETVTVFGCYLEQFRSLDEFSEEEISRAYYEARARKPKVIGQALRDAKNVRGYLVEGTKKGRFRLSNIGENLVLHDLPRKV